MFLSVVSRLFDPLVVFGMLTLVGALRSGMTGQALLFFLLVILLGMVCPPLSFLAWAIRTGRVSNWDVSNRVQRVYVLASFIPFLLLDFFLVYYFGNAYLFRLFLVFAFWFIGFFGITLVFKLSGHVAAIAFATALIVRWFGLSWLPIILFVPVMAWVRLRLNKHTLLQTIVGAVYSWGIFLALLLSGLV